MTKQYFCDGRCDEMGCRGHDLESFRDCPERALDEEEVRAALIEIGYWRDNGNRWSSPGHLDAQARLPDPRYHVDPNWDAAERAAVIRYLRAAQTYVVWRGAASCRICGITNGSACKSDGTYRWPSGYAHYLEKHDVRPPQAFIDHALSMMKEKGRF